MDDLPATSVVVDIIKKFIQWNICEIKCHYATLFPYPMCLCNHTNMNGAPYLTCDMLQFILFPILSNE